MIKHISVMVIALLLVACASSGQKTVEQRRADVQKMVQETVSSVQKHQSNIRQKMAAAPGYAVFSNANVNLIFASFSGGYGVAHNNANGKDTYMKMGEAGIGLGLGVKDFRAVFIFKTRAAFDRFVESGWMVGAHADAAAKADDKGGAAAAEIVADDVEIYQLTEAGLALQATIKGTKYWQDDALN